MAQLQNEHGSYSSSLKSLLRCKDFCTSTAYSSKLCLEVLRQSLMMNNWGNVSAYLNKATYSENSKNQDMLDVTRALLSLHSASQDTSEDAVKSAFATAAANFVGVKGVPAEGFDQIALPRDITLYGTILSLAASPDSVVRGLSSAFSVFLGLDPVCQALLDSYVNSNYATTLSLLTTLTPVLLSDMFIASHAETLVSMITDRCIRAYLQPYSRISLARITPLFGVRCRALIESGGLTGYKIDDEAGVLVCVSEEESLMEVVSRVGEEVLTQTEIALFVGSLQENGIMESSLSRGKRGGGTRNRKARSRRGGARGDDQGNVGQSQGDEGSDVEEWEYEGEGGGGMVEAMEIGI
jgi:hypothetical protein